ncbi:MAG: protein kinase [Acidobacteria bacterium]|nr:protein kinase [Acidobacteriota bacterium]
MAETVMAGREMPDSGRRIGPYRVIRELGHGGMGTVYLAERADQQYEARVALKVVKRGMDTDEVLRRFCHERQILAQLEHPNIARLLDGGTTEDGLPYLVIEYVKGEPIDMYCDRPKLSVIERLSLFRTVCAAVQFAHQNLVVFEERLGLEHPSGAHTLSTDLKSSRRLPRRVATLWRSRTAAGRRLHAAPRQPGGGKPQSQGSLHPAHGLSEQPGQARIAPGIREM